MDVLLASQGRYLLLIGVGVLLFTSAEGFLINKRLASPRLGLSTHTLGGLLGVMVLALGLMWPKLNFGDVWPRLCAHAAFWCLIYSVVGTIVAVFLAAVWGAGNELMPQAAGSARGSDLQEAVIFWLIVPAVVTTFISLLLIFWGIWPR
jgi:hydroxylaminobenzene mutase